MGALLLRKGTDGRHRLVGHFSNRWRDWDFHSDPLHGGEIISREAHKEYERWLDGNRQHAPELWIWHAYGSALKSRADWWAFSDNFFWMSWPLTEEEAEGIAKWEGEEDLGMSFGFYAFKRDQDDGVISRYRAFEASILPRAAAANKWTGISLVGGAGAMSKGVREMIGEKKRLALAKIHGEAFANQLVALDQEWTEMLDAAGIDSKELGDDEEAAAGAAVETPPPAEDRAGVVTEVTTEVAAEVATVPASEHESAAAKAVAAGALETSELEERVVGALKRLEGALAGDIKTLVDRLEEVESKLSALEAREEQDAKAAAMPTSLIAAYAPVSILDAGETRGKGGSAVIDGRSALARSAPAGTRSGGYISTLLGSQ